MLSWDRQITNQPVIKRLKYTMIRYLNLPRIPQSIIDNLNYNFEQYQTRELPADFRVKASVRRVTKLWSDSYNQEINEWCKKNICESMYWAFLITDGDLAVHVEEASKGLASTKLNYIIQPGGSNVVTNFWEDDAKTLKQSFCIEPHRWHIFKADSYHSVQGIEPGKFRFSVTGKVFP